jgi:3-oxoacyl-(acyl-carrier-protein) synthase
MKEGRSFISKITKFDVSSYPFQMAGEIKELKMPSSFSPRLLRKLDRFSHLCLVATEEAIQDAKLKLAEENLDRTGVIIGNLLGGWQFAEAELRDLHLHGVREVSSYQATAWFPAAPQGEISIYYKTKGYSKTIIADRASGLAALGYAFRTIRNNRADIIFAGGGEAPITPYALLCCTTSGEVAKEIYRPFDKKRDGYIIAEGSGILVLEELEHARKRRAPIYAEVVGYGATSDGYDRVKYSPDARELARAIKVALVQGAVTPEAIDYISLDGAASGASDRTETLAIKEVFGARAYEIPMSAPKSMIGNLLGASGPVDLITTLLTMKDSTILPTINYESPDPDCDLDYISNRAREGKVRNALVIGRGRGGINTALIVKSYE